MSSTTETPRIDRMEKMADGIADLAEMARTIKRELVETNRLYESAMRSLVDADIEMNHMRAALAAKDAEIERLNECLTAYGFGDVPKGWDDAIARAEKAEAALEEMTGWRNECGFRYNRAKEERDQLRARVVELEQEVEGWRNGKYTVTASYIGAEPSARIKVTP